MFLTGRGDGVVETWDLQYGHASPALTTWVSHEPVTGIKMASCGSLALASSSSGVASLLQLSPGLVDCSRQERQVGAGLS